MRRFFSDMNPTVRGLLVVALIAFLVVALNLYVTLAALYAIAGIAFFLAIAFFVYLLWRDRRQEIATWPAQAKIAFYLGALATGQRFERRGRSSHPTTTTGEVPIEVDS